MTVPLQPVSLIAPGFYGLNRQQEAAELDINWALYATNCIIDDSGRIAARNGWSNVTTVAGTSNSTDIDQVFEYLQSSGTTEVISSATEATENLAIQSEDFSTSWTVSGTTISTNSAIAPDGATTADKLVEDGTTGLHRVYQSDTTAAGRLTASLYVKAAERDDITLQVYNATDGTLAQATFDLAAGTYSGVTGSASIQALANDWYRISVTSTASATVTTNSLYIYLHNGSTTNYTGDGSSGLYIWGAQMQDGATMGFYAPTTTATISRSAFLFVGSTFLDDRTGALTPTASNWKFQNFNGNVVGFQDSHDPVIYKGSGNFTKLVDEHTDWQASTAYAVGDTCAPTTSNNKYYECTASTGTFLSGGTEPTWPTTDGNTVVDNEVTWTCRSIPQSNECLAAYGRTWITDSTKTVVYYSDLLIPWDYHGGSAGSIDLKSVWVYGMDQIEALASFNGYLIIFGRKQILVYQNANDPNGTMALVENLRGIGCIARDSVQDIGTDLFFLSDTGIRSFQRTIQEKSMPMNDVSKHVRDYLMSFASTETASKIRSAYYEDQAFYLVTFPTVGVSFCFDVRSPLQDGASRCTYWDSINPTAMCVLRTGEMYFGMPGVIAQYTGYNDDTDTYNLLYKTVWTNGGNTMIKIPKRIRVTVSGGNGYNLIMSWGFDYHESDSTAQKTITTQSTLAEYNIAEYSVDEYSGTTGLATVDANMRKSGEVMRIGWSVPINGQGISFQKADVYFKTGRINR